MAVAQLRNVRRHMRVPLILLALGLIRASAIEIVPTVESCAAVFSGEVMSVQMLHSFTNRSAGSDVHVARVRVSSVTKEDRKLDREVTVYYVHSAGSVCPRPMLLVPKEKATFYCWRCSSSDITNVLYLPSDSFVQRSRP
jgi:hypothetical protein